MTRYDPFSYGEVPLDSKQPSDAAPDAEDLLFAEGEQVKQAPPADSSWALMDEDVEGLLPGANPNAAEAIEFGAEVLGEGTPEDIPMSDPMTGGAAMSMEDLDGAMPPLDASPMMQAPPPQEQQQQQSQMPASQPEPEPAAPPQPAAEATPRRGREVRRRPLAVRQPAQAEAKPDAPREKQFAAVPPRRRLPILAAFLPITLCAGGGTAASWFWVMQGNPVMAGILGATTLVSALFAWLLLRG